MTDQSEIVIEQAARILREHENDYNFDPGGRSVERCSGCGEIVADFDDHHARMLADADLLASYKDRETGEREGEQATSDTTGGIA